MKGAPEDTPLSPAEWFNHAVQSSSLLYLSSCVAAVWSLLPTHNAFPLFATLKVFTSRVSREQEDLSSTASFWNRCTLWHVVILFCNFYLCCFHSFPKLKILPPTQPLALTLSKTWLISVSLSFSFSPSHLISCFYKPTHAGKSSQIAVSQFWHVLVHLSCRKSLPPAVLF